MAAVLECPLGARARASSIVFDVGASIVREKR